MIFTASEPYSFPIAVSTATIGSEIGNDRQDQEQPIPEAS
jgi:hypothetical protein